MDDYDEKPYATPYSRWRRLIEKEPYYSRHYDLVYTRYTAEGPVPGTRIDNSEIYSYEVTRKHSVAAVLDRIMGGL
jgi:hypothetical protein